MIIIVRNEMIFFNCFYDCLSVFYVHLMCFLKFIPFFIFSKCSNYLFFFIFCTFSINHSTFYDFFELFFIVNLFIIYRIALEQSFPHIKNCRKTGLRNPFIPYSASPFYGSSPGFSFLSFLLLHQQLPCLLKLIILFL